MTDNTHPYFGFYSAKHAEMCGTITYRLVDGTEVEVITITQTPDTIGDVCKWDDLVPVGELNVDMNKNGPSPLRRSQRWEDRVGAMRRLR